MDESLLLRLIPVLFQPLEKEFNVFRVMRHGTDEKQISNVFAWLLDADGTHNLGDAFQRIFVDAVNASLAGAAPIPLEAFRVYQEVNTAEGGKEKDIADLVLEGEQTRIVVENYETSCGHGHRYENYLRYAEQDSERGIVVLLCGIEDESAKTDGWQKAPVVTYPNLVGKLFALVKDDSAYQQRNPQPYSFFEQMNAHFVKGSDMNTDLMLDFVKALCDSGEGGRYGKTDSKLAGDHLADELSRQAARYFAESRDVLGAIKAKLKRYAEGTLLPRLKYELGPAAPDRVSARLNGIYLWTINLSAAGDGDYLQLKFGPTAWYANEVDRYWETTVADPEYSHVFITHKKEVRQSAVTLKEVLDGMSPQDTRLADEIVAFVKERQ